MAANFLKRTFARLMGLAPTRSVGVAVPALDPVPNTKDTAPTSACPFAGFPGLDAMPKPSGMVPGVGSALSTMVRYGSSLNGHLSIKDKVESLGKVYYDRIFNFKSVNVANPADAATVFRNEGKYPMRPEIESWTNVRKELGVPLGVVVSNGEEWYNYRRAMDRQIMVYSHLHKYVPALNEIASDYIQILLKNQANNPEGCVHDLKHEQFRWSLESTCRFVYDKRLGCLNLNAPMPAHVEEFSNAIDDMFQTSQILTILSTPMAKLLVPLTFWKNNRAWKTIMGIGRQIANEKIAEINQAEAAGRLEELAAQGGFLLSLLDEQRRETRGRNVNLNLDEVYVNAIEVMAGGVDTVATAQQWLMHLLAINPEKQERLRQELAPVKDGVITPEFLSSRQSSYLKACVKESMRLRPILVGTARVLDRDVVLGGYNVPKGTIINILDFVMANEEKNFPESQKFLPERWLKCSSQEEQREKAKAQNFSSQPFSFGPRMCIGRRVAEAEMYILTSRIVRDYQIVDMNGGLIEQAVNLLLMPKDPVKIRLEKLT